MRVNFSPRVLISRTAISPRRAARNDRARRLDGCFVFLERVAFAFPHFPTTRRAATRPSSSLSSSGGQRAKRQKRQAGETNLSHFVSFAPSLAGRMISHLFRRLISRPPALSPFSLSLFLSPFLSSRSAARFPVSSEQEASDLRSDPSRRVRHHQGPFSAHRVCLLTEALIKCRREPSGETNGPHARSSQSLRLLGSSPSFVSPHLQSLFLASSLSLSLCSPRRPRRAGAQ